MGTAERGGAVTATALDFPRRFRIGPVTVRPRSGRVRGPCGTQQIDPKVMAVLLRLAAAEGQVVSRETMMSDVWPGVVVSDTALSRCIYQLRKTLGEISGEDTSPIETLPKRGYRLAWPVRHDGRGNGPAPGPRAHRSLSLAVLAVVTLATLLATGILHLPDGWFGGATVAGDIRIAVFPPDDLSPDHDQQAFAIGLAREIAHELARFPELVIIGRSSSLSATPRSASLIDLARSLDADYVLGGSIRTIGPNRRVLLDLRRQPGDEILWSRSYLLAANAPFNVFRDVVFETAQLLEFSTSHDRGTAATENLEAFKAYLAAWNARDYNAKKAHLQRAVALDPTFAQAWNRLAAIEVMPVWNGAVTVEDAWSRAAPNITRALELVPDMPDALVTLGRFRREFDDLDGAITLFQRALEQDPGHAFAAANLGLVLRFAGRFEEALEVHRQGVEMDPLDAAAVTRLGTSYWFVEQFDEADRQYRRAAELAPDYEEIYDSWSGMLANGKGRLDLALLKMEQKIEVEGTPTPRSLAAKANLADLLGLTSLADEYWLRAARAASDRSTIDAQRAVHLLARGEPETARTLLEQGGLTTSNDSSAQLVLGLIDLQNGARDRFLQRIQRVYPGEATPLGADPQSIEAALLVALAYQVNGRRESAEHWLRRVEEAIGEPSAREHLWLAAVHAMRNEPTPALHELERSPPGRVLGWAPLASQDARFANLSGLPEFESLIEDRLLELEAQRMAYLNARDATVAALAD